jgi:SOS response regulatory protein OraA/RecX
VLECALRALRHRDRSASEIDERLRAQGFTEPERERTLETLARTGLLDDERFAHARAASLSARNAGDAFIRHALVQAGISAAVVDDALATLEPEPVRARAVVSARGSGPKTARYLSAKGFSHDAIAGAVAGTHDDALG